jgi:hypothetical protein
MDAGTAALVGALGATTLAGLMAYINERLRTTHERRGKDIDRKRDLYARFLFAVSEMTRGSIPEGRWMELRDEVGRLEYELILIAPTLAVHVEALAHDASVHTKHDRARGVVSFEGGASWDDHWDPLIAAMRRDLMP